MMSDWNHSICYPCWNVANPDRTPVRLVNPPPEFCCFCGQQTADGIWVRAARAGLPLCKGHSSPAEPGEPELADVTQTIHTRRGGVPFGPPEVVTCQPCLSNTRSGGLVHLWKPGLEPVCGAQDGSLTTFRNLATCPACLERDPDSNASSIPVSTGSPAPRDRTQFTLLRQLAERLGDGADYGGALLRLTGNDVQLVCQTCGVLDAEMTSDWMALCHLAINHVKDRESADGPGCQVAVSLRSVAVYGRKGPEDGKGG